jgi:hypothetical protein
MDELLSKISTDPALIDSMDKDGLLEAADALTAYITTQSQAILTGSSSPEDKKKDLEAAKEARERLTAVQGRLDAINEEEAALNAEAAALTEGLVPPVVEPVEESEGIKVETTDDVVVENNTIEEKEEALVAAQPSLGKIAARRPRDMTPPPAAPNNALVASMPSGEVFETGVDVAKAALAQHKQLGNTRPGAFTSYPIATFEYDHGYEVFNQESDYGVIEQAKAAEALRAQGNIDRLLGRPLSSLVAAIPTPCGPTEPVYTMFSISARDGLLQVPTVNARRGSLSYPISPTQVTIDDTAAWDTAIATAWDDTAAKPFYLVECPDPHTCTVVPYPTRLRFRNWEQRFNPEYVAHVMAESLTFGAHRMNATQIAAIRTLATDTNISNTFGTVDGGTIVSVAHTLAFAAARYRDTYKMSQDAALTVLSPAWVREALAVDLMTRQSTLSLENARARASALFAGFNLDVQWLYDTQTIVGGVAWPATADFTIYAPGTFVRLDGGGLTIAETRDSTLNGVNQFEFFTETSEVICQVGPAAWDILAVPVCPNGVTGGSVTDLCGTVS